MSATGLIVVCTRDVLDVVCTPWFAALDPPRVEVLYDPMGPGTIERTSDVPRNVVPPETKLEETLENVGKINGFPREVRLPGAQEPPAWRDCPVLYYLFDFSDMETQEDYEEALATPFPVYHLNSTVADWFLSQVSGGDQFGDSSAREKHQHEVFLFVTSY